MCILSHNTKYYIHAQDDMQMTQIGLNINIILPLSLYPNDIFSVSARCGGGKMTNSFRGKLDSITHTLWTQMDPKIAKLHGDIALNNQPIDIM